MSPAAQEGRLKSGINSNRWGRKTTKPGGERESQLHDIDFSDQRKQKESTNTGTGHVVGGELSDDDANSRCLSLSTLTTKARCPQKGLIGERLQSSDPYEFLSSGTLEESYK